MTERERLLEDKAKKAHWRKWGPYVSAREWGTVREDYSSEGDAWCYFTHDQARSRAYHWEEDGIFGLCDNHQRLCFAWAFWNGKDPILKERFFGLSNHEGNHGEDVKEYYFFLDNTPTHSYMKSSYNYPQASYPYEKLVEENKKRSEQDPEYELVDTGIFDENRYFEIFFEYVKAGPEDLLIQLTAINRGPETADLHILPTLWFRNTWSDRENGVKPHINESSTGLGASHVELGSYQLYFEDKPEFLFTENETNTQRLYGQPNTSPYVKDSFHTYVIQGDKAAVNPAQVGTKACGYLKTTIAAGQSHTLRLRLTNQASLSTPFSNWDQIFSARIEEATAFYDSLCTKLKTQEEKSIQRRAFAGMLWNKQFYHFVIEEWLKGDAKKKESLPRSFKRNEDWVHLYNDDILSVPDNWEYPCFFSWDTAFQALPLAVVDPEFAKRQLLLFTREWYMHPNGQIPAYEWEFSDVNPPVHAWAAWRVFKIEKKYFGQEDHSFLERIFQKLLLNFTWWINRKDADGKNIFQGGFLGLDNISVFNRSEDLPKGAKLYQSDATSWMGMYCLNMLTIALELAQKNQAYEDLASKFLEHFLYIADAINYSKKEKLPLWHEEDGFYYDVLQSSDGSQTPLRIRSMVGIIPMFAVATISAEQIETFSGFSKRLDWFLQNRGDLCEEVACMRSCGEGGRRLFAIMNPERLKRVLHKMLDEKEFLSPYGIRSLSKYHQEHPFTLRINGGEHSVGYEPAESHSRLFGGNSNWRGPIWFPLNMLIIESLQKYHHYLGDEYKVECPTGSGKWMNLWEVSGELSKRLINIFTKDHNGHRPVFGDTELFQDNPLWKDEILFYEYFNGDNGAGLGASHQTGWTALVSKLIGQCAQYGFLKDC